MVNHDYEVYLSNKIFGIPSASLKTQLGHIKAIQFHFTDNITKDNIINKAEKYQTPNTVLFMVGTQWYAYNNVLQTPQDTRIRYPENVKVISHALFADLIGLEDVYRIKFNNIIDHNTIDNIEHLKELHQTYNTKWHVTEELKEDLNKNKLIKRNINEYFKIALKKEKIQRQLF